MNKWDLRFRRPGFGELTGLIVHLNNCFPAIQGKNNEQKRDNITNPLIPQRRTITADMNKQGDVGHSQLCAREEGTKRSKWYKCVSTEGRDREKETSQCRSRGNSPPKGVAEPGEHANKLEVQFVASSSGSLRGRRLPSIHGQLPAPSLPTQRMFFSERRREIRTAGKLQHRQKAHKLAF